MHSAPARTGWIPSPLARRVLLFPALLLGLVMASASDGQDRIKGKPKPKNEVATDPAKAGPDYAVQGEYLGTAGKEKLGAEVIARGDGKFEVNFLPGGLRGEGGEYARSIQAAGKSEGGKTVVRSKDGKWTATIEGSGMTGTSADGTLSLRKVIRESTTLGKAPPAGAVVLFNSTDASEWKNGKVVNGNLLGSDVASKKKFKDHKIHLEFRLSFMPYQRGQGRSNSGVYVQQRYEIQVLDSFGLKGLNNECGGVYQQADPLVNMCYPPLQWQTYDIELKAARFEGGKKVSDAVLTLRHNGVLVQNRLKLKGPSPGGGAENNMPGALFLQGHGGQVEYRNIWVVEYDKADRR